MAIRLLSLALLATACAAPAFAQLRVTLAEPTHYTSRARVDTIDCPDNRKLEVGIAYAPENEAGERTYTVTMKVDGKAVDASAIEQYLSGYNVMSSDVTVAGCPDARLPHFNGEIVYWKGSPEQARWQDRVFVRFQANASGVTAELVANHPPPQH